ncbi:MAG: 50S ribosomal protein L32 [Acidimicrobiia bacterium]|nr:50S ribosomal protein L32 [Acidimicrobiia bacterium]MBP8180193.1 50S ribosomal protein L32 [Acidimicrobiia bacterium]
MAVPKRKTPQSKSRTRRAEAWKLRRPSASTCPRCGTTKRPHTVCKECGWYAGREAVRVD